MTDLHWAFELEFRALDDDLQQALNAA